MAKKIVSDVEVTRHTAISNYCMTCNYDGARYLVSFAPKQDGSREMGKILYKKPLSSVKSNSLYHFNTRYLGVTSRLAEKIIAEMLAIATAQNLFVAADKRLSLQTRKEERFSEAREKVREELQEYCRLRVSQYKAAGKMTMVTAYQDLCPTNADGSQFTL